MRVLWRLALVAAVALAVGASASSSQQRHPVGSYTGPGAAPPSQPMDPAVALGLWKSSFGPVKIELDRSGEGAGDAAAQLMGVWVYERDGQEIIGFFAGPLEGNVLHFDWEEPAEGEPLRGSGYLIFEPGGGSFSGRWWTEARDRGGEWTGWRAGAADPGADPGYSPEGPPEGYDPSYGEPGGGPEPGYDPSYGDPGGPPPDSGYDPDQTSAPPPNGYGEGYY